MFFAYLSMAYNIISGYGGQLSLGHAAYVGIGAYTSTIMFTQFGISPWIGIIAGGIAACLTSFVIGFPCFRLNIRGPYFALATLGFSEMVRIYFSNTKSLFGINIQGSMGILIPPLGHSFVNFQFDNKIYYYYVILALLVGIIFFTYCMDFSKIGYYLKAIKGSQSAAESVGVSPLKMKLIANGISAFFSGMGGVFYAQWILFINPERIMGLTLNVDLLIICMVGGFGTIFGPVLGAALMIPVAEVSRIYLGATYLGSHLILYGLILIICVYFLPNGLIGPLNEWYIRFKKILKDKPAEEKN
jgi:branched-chain amino acid transport system permease protein